MNNPRNNELFERIFKALEEIDGKQLAAEPLDDMVKKTQKIMAVLAGPELEVYLHADHETGGYKGEANWLAYGIPIKIDDTHLIDSLECYILDNEPKLNKWYIPEFENDETGINIISLREKS